MVGADLLLAELETKKPATHAPSDSGDTPEAGS